jgi:hypothetical protein
LPGFQRKKCIFLVAIFVVLFFFSGGAALLKTPDDRPSTTRRSWPVFSSLNEKRRMKGLGPRQCNRWNQELNQLHSKEQNWTTKTFLFFYFRISFIKKKCKREKREKIPKKKSVCKRYRKKMFLQKVPKKKRKEKKTQLKEERKREAWHEQRKRSKG